MIRAFTLKPATSYIGLNIIEEFAGLSPKYKLMFCEKLFVEGQESYAQAVQKMWPKANEIDVKKLEKFLILLKNTSH